LNRKAFLSLLGLTSCIEDMSLFQSLIAEGGDVVDLFAIFGDSVGRGNSTAPGSTPTLGTVTQYNQSADTIVNILNLDTLEVQAAGTDGSWIPRFGIDYNAATGRTVGIISTAVGGTYFWSSTTSLSWWTNGPLYSDAKTKIDAGMAKYGKTALTAAIVVLGVNDACQTGYTLDITLLESLIDRINTDYNTPRIIISIPTKTNASTTNLKRLFAIRVFARRLTETYANVEIGFNYNNLEAWDAATYFQGDEFHLTFDGNEKMGSLLARQMAFGSTYHKFTRSVLGALNDDVSSAFKTAYDNFITGCDSDGNLALLARLFLWDTDTSENGEVEWGQIGAGGGTADFVANGYIQTDQTSKDYRVTPLTISQLHANYDSDFIIGAWCLDNLMGSGVDGALFGVRENAGAGLIDTAQNTVPDIYFRTASTATTSATENSYADDSLYCLALKSGTRDFIKNTAVADTAANSAAAMGTLLIQSFIFGARNNVGSIDSRGAFRLTCGFGAKYTGFDVSAFHGRLVTLFAAI